MMKGDIHIKSARGAGTSVLFNIHCKDSFIEKDSQKGELSEKLQGQEDGILLKSTFASEHPFNILVAENNLMNQKLIIMILEKLG
jgi:hypothetical protein